MLLRSLNLRRLSYVIFAGEKNTFLTQLPTIQEKFSGYFSKCYITCCPERSIPLHQGTAMPSVAS